MRIFLLHGAREQGPMTLDELRDRLDLRMIGPDQACRIAGIVGTYVAGEIVTGQLFRGWEIDEEDDEDEEAEDLEVDEDDIVEDDGDPGDDDGLDEDEMDIEDEDEDSEDDDPHGLAWDMQPMWEGRPGYSAYLGQILFITLLGGAAAAAFVLDWSGWLGAAMIALLFCCVALILGNRQGTRYAIYQRRLEWTEPGFISRTREVPRSAVHAIEVVAPFPGNLLGRADVIFVHDRPGIPGQVVFRQIARAHKVRQLWRS